MKKHLSISFSKVFLNIVLFVLTLLIAGFTTSILFSGIDTALFKYFIVCITYFFIIYNLRKIVYSANSMPFSSDNVKRFKKIGCYMIAMAVIDGITNWKVQSHFTLLDTGSGSLKGSFLMYLILTCIAFVLSEIFEKAVEIKNENDLTI